MMSKYAPLGQSLKKTGKECVPVTFSEIEKILRFRLPPTARNKREWWSNNPSGHSQAPAWLNAGYRTERVDMMGEKLVFRRVSPANAPDAGRIAPSNEAENEGPKKAGRHPVFGCMKGTVTIPDDVDLTEPADPEWARLIEEKYPRK